MAQNVAASSDSSRKRPHHKTVADFRASYWKSRRLAAGSYGDVYLVMHLTTRETRAAKYQKNLTHDGLEEARREARVLSRLSHRHIVRYIDYFEDPLPSPSMQLLKPAPGGRAIMVTEYLEAGELFDLISKRGFELREDKCRTIFRQVLSAVAYLHSLGLAHLDLKPENMLLTRVGGGSKRRLKLIDFGLALEIGGKPYVTMERMCGTMEMMAPEVMRCSHASCASDMWSLGVILFMLLSGGVSPFWAGSIARTQRRVLKVSLK